jgi:uncharacterized membrane protein
MTLEPLLDASLAIKIHVAAVVPAAILGAYLLMRRKGTPVHRLLGKVWLALMVITALSSFFIHALNMFHGFSPIHLISIYVLFASWRAFSAARRHDIARHRKAVTGLYFGGIGIAGLFTLVPGRIMSKVVFSGSEWLPVVILGVIAVFLGWVAWSRGRGARQAV